MNKFSIGQAVQYQYSNTEVRHGEVVEYDQAADRYRVLWTKRTYDSGKSWDMKLRTWVRPTALKAVA